MNLPNDIAIILVESEERGLQAQRLLDPEDAKAAFDSLRETVDKKPARATYLRVRFEDGNPVVTGVESKTLPDVRRSKTDSKRLGEQK